MGGVPPLQGDEVSRLLSLLGNDWQVVKGHHLEKKFDFPDFRQALAFANRVGEVAEEQGHHPDVYLAWGRVVLTIWTHKIDGLTESDFIFAAKADLQLHGGARSRSAMDDDRRQDQDDIRRAIDEGVPDLRVKS